MRNFILLCFYLANTALLSAQDLSGQRWALGEWRKLEARFNGTQRPMIVIVHDTVTSGFPYYSASSAANICDSASGKLLFFTNGMKLWDSAGNVMPNGDSLQYQKIYTQNNPPLQGQTQGALILPKGSNGQYYVFIPTVTDSLYDALWVPQIRTPFNQLRYSVVDMNLNGGLGAVSVKNKILLQGTEMVRTKMQACRHANGYDWWLLKQTEYGPNTLTRFLVTPDSIYGPYVQSFAEPDWGDFDFAGQIAFSRDGNLFASVQGKRESKLFLADFDRCTGELSNPKLINIPLDSTTIPNPLPWYVMDSLVAGVAFSPSGQFIYITRRFNIYQYEPGQPDSSLAWVRIKHGEDTTYAKFQYYHHLYPGADGRIYIGNEGGQAKQFSVIDYPNLKGTACGFCRKCFRLDTSANFGVAGPPNLPDFNLGPDVSKPCWPLGIPEQEKPSWLVYPNPNGGLLWVEGDTDKPLRLLDLSGRDIKVADELISSRKHRLDLHQLPPGLYVLRVGNKAVMVKKE